MLKQSQESNDKDYHCFIERAQVSHVYISSLYCSFLTEKKNNGIPGTKEPRNVSFGVR